MSEYDLITPKKEALEKVTLCKYMYENTRGAEIWSPGSSQYKKQGVPSIVSSAHGVYIWDIKLQGVRRNTLPSILFLYVLASYTG